MEIVSKDKTFFVSNFKTLELNTWFHLLMIQGIGLWWVIIGPKSIGIGFEYIF